VIHTGARAPGAAGGRWAAVPPERLSRWLSGLVQRHGPVAVVASDGWPEIVVPAWAALVRLGCADGSRWAVRVPFPPVTLDWVEHVGRDRRLGLLLIRRGGWAVGLADGPALVASQVGRGYVQARTAAGGWSQQRYARRREGQSAALVAAAAVAADELLVAALGPSTRPLDAVVTGGDRLLLRQALAERRLHTLAGLVSPRVLDVPDPRLAVLQDAVPRARSVEVRLV
jgi:hypothetical protein